MTFLADARYRLRALFRRRQMDAELAAELDHHVATQAAAYQAAGMGAAEARRRALIDLGGIEYVKEQTRDARGTSTWETSMQDLRYLARSLRARPGFAAVVVATVAVGVGATTALFSVVDAVLLRGAPFHAPQRLVALWETPPGAKDGRNEVTAATFHDWTAERAVFDRVAAFTDWRPNLTEVEEPERLEGREVSRDFFQTLGTAPLLGRPLRPDEWAAGRNTVVVISYNLWRRRFRGDSAAVGTQLTLDGRRHTVVGVMPEGFQLRFPLPESVDLWRPGLLPERIASNRRFHFLYVFARLRDGVTPAQAQAALSGLARRFEQEYPATNTGWGARVVPLREEVVGGVRPLLRLGGAAVALVLLIACANVANLLLASGAARSREFAVRTAIGASRARVVRQLVTEGVALAVVGAVAGLPLAYWLTGLLTRLGPAAIRSAAGVGLDARALGFSFALATLVGALFSVGSVAYALRVQPGEVLKEGPRGASAGRARSRVREALVSSEVALATMLLIGAGLTLKSFARLLDVDPGFRPGGVLTFELSLPEASYGEPPRVAAFYDELLRRLGALPGVREAGVVNYLPLAGGDATVSVRVPGRPPPAPGQEPEVNYRIASSGYFPSLGLRFVRGRPFEADDAADGWRVAILSETAARRLFPGEDPMGRHVRTVSDSNPLRVVGVVGDVRHGSLERPPSADMYMPVALDPWRTMRVVVHTAASPEALAGSVRREVRALDSSIPLEAFETMEQVVARSTDSRRFGFLLLGCFSSIALVLAAGGVFAMVGFAVNQRTQEIGVRMALGASPRRVLVEVLSRGLVSVGIGLAVGVGLALALATLMSAMLFGVDVRDPAIYAAAPVVLGLVAALSAVAPARRAARIDPVIAMRSAA